MLRNLRFLPFTQLLQVRLYVQKVLKETHYLVKVICLIIYSDKSTIKRHET